MFFHHCSFTHHIVTSGAFTSSSIQIGSLSICINPNAYEFCGITGVEFGLFSEDPTNWNGDGEYQFDIEDGHTKLLQLFVFEAISFIH